MTTTKKTKGKEGHWDFYFFVADGRPCSTMLDLSLVSGAPDAERPWLVSIRIPLRDPRPDGLASNAEATSLGSLEDGLVRSIDASCGGVFVGRMTWNGVRDLFFYVKRTETLEQALGAGLTGTEPRRVMTRKQKDAEWRHYLDVLYPGPLEWQWIKDRRLVESLAESGDKSDIARPIDHHARFADRSEAEAWAIAVRQMGFEVAIERVEGSEEAWSAHAVREDPSELAHVHDIVERLYGLAEEHGGTYDGWGCSVVRGHDL
jgi:regulator of RNase E activity RraB